MSITELKELQQEAKELFENSRNEIEDENKDRPVNTLENAVNVIYKSDCPVLALCLVLDVDVRKNLKIRTCI